MEVQCDPIQVRSQSSAGSAIITRPHRIHPHVGRNSRQIDTIVDSHFTFRHESPNGYLPGAHLVR